MKTQRERKRYRPFTAHFWRDVLSVATASLLLHGLVLLIVSMIPPERPPWQEKAVALVTDFVEETVVELPVVDTQVPELDRMLDLKLDELIPESEPVAPEEIVQIEEVPIEEDSADDLLDELADLANAGGEDAGGKGLEALALSGMDSLSSGDGLPAAFQGRSKSEKKKKAKTYGGSPQVLDAVEKALSWLACHQNPDGSWPIIPSENKLAAPKVDAAKAKPAEAKELVDGAKKAEGADKPAKGEEFIESVTASALLAFLGAGHTEMSGPYKHNIRKGINYLNERVLSKAKNPLFGRNYGSALILMALSESSIFGSNPRTTKNANAIAEMFVKMYDGKGWSYSGKGDDFSVSGWVALGLKSARQAELPSVSDETFQLLFANYGKWVNSMTHPDTGEGNYRTGKTGSIAMSWVGMFQKQFLGFPRNDPFLVSASELGIKKISSVFNVDKMTWADEYSIYYGTLAAFQQQGDFWNKWNPVMQKVLMGTQRDGPKEQFGGSWDPSNKHIGSSGGRAMSTAILALCLEVYYRYAVMH